MANFYRKLVLQNKATWKIETKEFSDEKAFHAYLDEIKLSNEYTIVYCLSKKSLTI